MDPPFILPSSDIGQLIPLLNMLAKKKRLQKTLYPFGFKDLNPFCPGRLVA